MTSRDQLFLVDGYALIYRSFFAMINRPLRTSRGENTSAVWGVANFLHRLLDQWQPGFLAWVHDAGTSFRKEAFPQYKATREKLDHEMQQDFDRSVTRTEEVLRAFGVPLVAVNGYEADDVIGTLACQAVARGLQAVIVSGDKDFYQLISDDILVLNPGRGGPSPVGESLVGPENAAERLGVPPQRVVDYLALVGDSSDNIPGVKGVGDKTARALIQDYGDLESILSMAGKLKAKRAREALLQHADDARLSRDLVTIRRDVPVTLDVEGFRVGRPDTSALTALYAELEFHSLASKLRTPTRSVAPGENMSVVGSTEEVAEVVKAAREAEVAGLELIVEQGCGRQAALIGLAIGIPSGRTWYLPFGHRSSGELLAGDDRPYDLPEFGDPTLRPLTEWLGDPAAAKAGHDVKRIWLGLRAAGVELRGLVYDSMLASFVLEPGRRSHDLADLVREHLELHLDSLSEVVGKGTRACPVAEADVDKVARYCCSRCAAVLQLRDVLSNRVRSSGVEALLDTIEVPLVGVLVDMEWRGIGIDVPRLEALSERLASELGEIEQRICDAAGTRFNINSTAQLRHVLFEKLGLPVLKHTKTGPSTDAGVLSALADSGFEVPRLLLSYRELSKLKSTYVDVLPRSVDRHTGRVHTTFNQTGAATGRLSSSDPNLQNIPVRTPRGEQIRECFVPAPGCQFVVADYSQIELRVLAHLSRDPVFIEAFQRGGDIHRETAAIVFDVPIAEVTTEMRARAKTINFATLYGQGPYSLARQLGISQDDAAQFIRLYFERFAGVRRFLDETIERARREGWVETLFGRRRYIPELRDSNRNVRAFGERTAMNSPIQGSAADLIKIAMVNLARALERAGMESAILLQVHDELVLEAPQAEVDAARDLVKREMEGAAKLRVPLVVDIGVGPNWLAAKP